MSKINSRIYSIHKSQQLYFSMLHCETGTNYLKFHIRELLSISRKSKSPRHCRTVLLKDLYHFRGTVRLWRGHNSAKILNGFLHVPNKGTKPQLFGLHVHLMKGFE